RIAAALQIKSGLNLDTMEGRGCPTKVDPAPWRARESSGEDKGGRATALLLGPLRRSFGMLPCRLPKGVFHMRAKLAAIATLLAMTSYSQPTQAGSPYLGFPFYFGDYSYYYGDYPPEPLIVPYGYYGYRDGGC